MNFEVRTFTEQDRAELGRLFHVAGRGSPSESLWGHEKSEEAVYLSPYMDLEPESLFVAIVDAAMVGYLTGCLDSSAFPSESDRIDRAIKDHRLLRHPAPVKFFLRASIDVLTERIMGRSAAGELADRRWPAHLHINVVAEFRGGRVAPALMSRWIDRLVDAGSPGCHLQTLVENTRAVRFFERFGFANHGQTPLVPGMRHEGHRLHQQTMVWSSEGEGHRSEHDAPSAVSNEEKFPRKKTDHDQVRRRDQIATIE